MEPPGTILADIEKFGKIYRCGNCDNIHLQIGPVTVLLSVEAYMQLVALVHASAVNFEASIVWSRGNDDERFG